MNEEEVREIVKEEINKNNKVPLHVHDGVTGLKISQKDIIHNQTYVASLQSIASETFSINAIQNATQLSFHGFAANNAGGGSATKRATISGTAQLRSGLNVTQLVPSVFSEVSFVQSSNSMFENDTGPALRASFSIENFAYVQDDTGAVVATGTVVGYTNNSISIQTVLASGWQLYGGYLIS